LSKKRKSVVAAFASVSLIGAAPVYAVPDISPVTETVSGASECESVGQGFSNGEVYKDRSCVLLTDFLASPDAYKGEKMHGTLTMLFNSSAMGRQMLTEAAAEGYRLCDMNLPPYVAAMHFKDDRKIGVDYSHEKSQLDYLTNVVHELGHFYQQSHFGVNHFALERSLYDNQRVMLAMETAAPVMEVIAVYEAGLAGSVNWRAAYMKNSIKRQLLENFDQEYNLSRSSGESHRAAINRAAASAWQAVLQDQYKLDFYNNRAARTTLMYSEFLRSDMTSYDRNAVIDQVNNAGRIGDTISFTSFDALPSTQRLFGKSDQTRQFFEAVEWYRISKIWGTDHPDVQARYDGLVTANNAFIQKDFEQVICKMKQGMNTRDALDDTIVPLTAAEISTRVNVNVRFHM